MAKIQKTYFVADIHLGASAVQNHKEHENIFVSWLNSISKDATSIFLLGDIFDYWFEYKKVVPKGFVRTLGKLAELSDNGIDIHFFAGNHDQWSFGYLEKEIGLKFHHNEFTPTINNKKFYLHHGDGLGKFEKRYKLLKKVFRSKIARWLFSRLHPNCGTSMAHRWSSKSRLGKGGFKTQDFLGEEKEFQVLFAKDMLQKKHYDYFIFGHRHLPFDIKIDKNTRVISLGDWVSHFKYAVFDGKDLSIETYKTNG